MNSESSNSTSASQVNQANQIDDDDSAPLWKYVTRLEKGKDKGGNWRWQCNFCGIIKNSSHTRVSAHLLRVANCGIIKCTKVKPELRAEMERLVAEAERRKEHIEVPLPPNPPNSNHISVSTYGMGAIGSYKTDEAKKRKANSAIGKAFNVEDREHLKSLIARMFYSSGLPFHLARNPYYLAAFAFAADKNISGFVPPGYNALRTTLLTRERANVESMLQETKGKWSEKGVSLVSDGWSDPQRRPLLNFMAVTDGEPVFLKAVNCQGEYKDKHFIADLMRSTILEIGPSKVVQVVTDNAPVCKAAGMIIESEFPNIFWTPCVVHTLNLALKNICAAKNNERNEVAYGECSWITNIADDATFIKNFITNHSMRLSMYNSFVSLKLLAVAETRFASVVVMLKRFKLVKRGLQELVISEGWSSYREDDVGLAANVKEIILNDVWWDKVDYILNITNPIYDMLRFADTDKPTLHLIYDMWDSMIEKVKKAIYRFEGKQEHEHSSFYSVVYSILVDRWTKSSTPLHCLAHALNPRYYSEAWLQEAPNRLPPHKDDEISEERNKCLAKYFPDQEDRRNVLIEYARFSGAMDVFANFDSLAGRANLDPKSWWCNFGSKAPMLQSLALKLLSQPCSSSCCERNWSTYSFIHSMRRNKIQPQRAQDLVYVHSNLRLLSRKKDEYAKGETKMWDVGGDSFDPLDGAGELEIAQLSFDEPEMERVIFSENDMSGGSNGGN